VAVPREHGTETLDSLKGEKFLDLLSDFKVPRKTLFRGIRWFFT
jgi:hypothetical protein